MSSIFSFFWSNSTNESNNSNEEKTHESVISSTPTVDLSNEYVMIDTPTDSSSTQHIHHSHRTSWDLTDDQLPQEQSVLSTPPSILNATPARSCRLYGQAHKPPRLYQQQVNSTPLSSSSSTTISPTVPTPTPSTTNNTSSLNGKRSFAEALKSAPVSSDKKKQPIAFAQSAESSIAEQLLAKIEQLENLQSMVAPSINSSSDEVAIQQALEEANTSSPPLHPKVPLNSRMYDESTSWALNVDEPNSKRSKRSPSVTMIDATMLKSEVAKHINGNSGAKKKGKTQARLTSLGRSHARDEKASLQM